MTLEQFHWLEAQQDYKCAICGTSEPMGTYNVWHVDHCHDTGRVRGILCFKCNMGLGKFDDSPLLLRLAIEYLLREPLVFGEDAK